MGLLSVFRPIDGRSPLDLTLFSSSWKDRLALSGELADAKTVDRRVPVRVLNLAWHRLQWPPAEMLAGHPFDVAHSLHPLLMPARDAAQVITIHDLDFMLHPERTSREIRRDYPALARRHAARADRVIVVSHFTADQTQRLLDVPADRISVCSPGAPAWPARTARATKERRNLDRSVRAGISAETIPAARARRQSHRGRKPLARQD